MTITSLNLPSLPSKHETLQWIATDQAFVIGFMLGIAAVLMLGLWMEYRTQRLAADRWFVERVARQMKERDNAAFLRANGVHK